MKKISGSTEPQQMSELECGWRVTGRLQNSLRHDAMQAGIQVDSTLRHRVLVLRSSRQALAGDNVDRYPAL